MRTEDEMLNLIINKATGDDRIRAVVVDGSRANINATHDKYSDFDIVYYVTDVREFTNNNDWINYFGDILIVQYPIDWYSHPYDYSSREKFQYLIQFSDGNRIDLSIVDVINIDNEKYNNEPRRVLINKDNFKELIPINDESAFYIKQPSFTEFKDICNEFRWLSIYISKGICREDLYYAKYNFDVLAIEMFMKMLVWRIGIYNGFNINLGANYKYLKKYLKIDEIKKLQSIFPNGEYEDMWNKLFVLYDYFHELEVEVASYYNYECSINETIRVRDFLEKRRLENQ